MTAALLLRGLARGKARFACAAAGVAAATGAVVFTFALVATNRTQAPELARRASAPWAAWRFEGLEGRMGRGRGGRPAAAESPRRPEAGRPPAGRPADLRLDLVAATIDYRPGGRVLQGPPMSAVLAEAPEKSPWDCAALDEGRWPDRASGRPELACTRGTLKRFGRGETPPVGTEIKFVGSGMTMTATLVGYLADARLPPGWPSAFVNAAAFAAFAGEPHGKLELWRSAPPAGKGGAELLTPESETVVGAFAGDENRRMDYARPLMFAAAVLTALALLVNSLLLSVEARRRELAVLRTVGMTGGGVVRLVAAEAMLAVAAGWAAGSALALLALRAYVAADPVAFPVGPAPLAASARVLAATAAVGTAVALAATFLFALRPALSVKPLDALAARGRPRRRGMAVAFALGFGAFVAVEVWGASLMRGFVPSPEWPDAIVSILPTGADPCDRAKLDGLPGVARISELYPLQLPFDPPLEMKGPGGGRGGRPALRNALFLGAEWLPRFEFAEGDWESANEAVFSGRACVVSEMVARAHGLHAGGVLRVRSGQGRGGPGRLHELPVAGVVDLNWHMVTSRGLVRGLNGAPPMTDGAVFVSLDTANWLDPRPFLATVNMTHLWVEYEKDFLEDNGVFPAGRKVEGEIAAALGNPEDSTVRLHARDEIADGTLAHGSDVIGQAARVPFAFLAILSIGFVAMLVADADAARGELATLRAVGATRSQLAWRLARGAVSAAVRGVVFGIPAGALCGWLFSLKTGSLWPGMPHHFAVPWRVIAEGAAGSVAFAVAVAVPTAMRLVSRARLSGEGR